jgi:hypothetical protein
LGWTALTVVPVFVALIFSLMVALATKVNSSWTGQTLNTLCPIILPFSTKNGFPNEVAGAIVNKLCGYRLQRYSGSASCQYSYRHYDCEGYDVEK